MPTLDQRWTIKPIDEQKVNDLATALKINPVICRLLILRGIDTFEKAKEYFRPDLSMLHDPFLMKDMDKAVHRILNALEKGETIMVYGDYDVDGTTSVALLAGFLQEHHDKVLTYIPDRYKEGYGISEAGVKFAAEKNVSLMVALDCGIKANKQIELAVSLGLDVIICDHHLPGDKLPNAVAILDPKQTECNYPYDELSGCGIGFKLIQALAPSMGIDEHGIYKYLDLVAISIASDIVPMTGENRVLAHFGLKKLNTEPLAGVRALISESGVFDKDLNIGDVVFKIGPRINAAGRMNHASEALNILLAKNESDVTDQAAAIGKLNEDRKTEDKRITEEALSQIIERNIEDQCSTVVYSPDWHKGVIGIVASRLTEHYYRPTIVLSKNGDKIVGSARSVKGFSVYDAIDACSDLLIQFGGHKYAAGLTMKVDALEDFINRFEEVVKAQISPELLIPEIKVDSELNLNDLSLKFYEIIEQMAPFGPANMRPVFLSKNLNDIGFAELLKEEHLKLVLRQDGSDPIKAIGFFMKEHYPTVKEGAFDMLYTLRLNEWQGRRSVELEIKDIRASN